MMSKALFIVLVGCVVALASPIKQDVENATKTVTTVQDSIGSIIQKVGEAIGIQLKELFQKIQKHLNSEELRKEFEEIVEASVKIDEVKDKLSEEQLEYLEKETEKVSEAFGQVLEDAVELMDKNEEGIVNLDEFTKAVRKFKLITAELLQ